MIIIYNDVVILETVKLNSEEVDGEEEGSICLENYNKEDNIIKLNVIINFI